MLLPRFRDPARAGLIVGSPSYFRSLTGLAKCFLERLAPLREPQMVLALKLHSWAAGVDSGAVGR